MAEFLSDPPVRSALVHQRGFLAPSWLPWIQTLARAVRGIRATAAWNVGSTAVGDTSSTLVSIPGAQLGDFVDVASDTDIQSMVLSGYVESTGSVRVTLANVTTGAVVLGTINLSVRVRSHKV